MKIWGKKAVTGQDVPGRLHGERCCPPHPAGPSGGTVGTGEHKVKGNLLLELNGASEDPNSGGFASEHLSPDAIPALAFGMRVLSLMQKAGTLLGKPTQVTRCLPTTQAANSWEWQSTSYPLLRTFWGIQGFLGC